MRSTNYRTHSNADLRLGNVREYVTLVGWVQKSRDLGGLTFIDLRDRYGITQLVFNMESDEKICQEARSLNRESVIQVSGYVIERSNKNENMPTGDIEVDITKLVLMNPSATPPFTIEENTDGGDDLRLAYRYLDLRRKTLQDKIALRHRVTLETRKFLDQLEFFEIETPYLIKSTPEGARDFVVPSRMNAGQFYALPQSPQTFKQLLMVSGFDRYFQIVKCFRDEDLRADRQPEFTQIDCEMAFVEKEDVLSTFESLIANIFDNVLNVKLESSFPRMTYDKAMENYGSDKPDLRFGMEFKNISSLAQGKGFKVFDSAEIVTGFCVQGCADYSRKKLDKITEWVKRPQVGAKGLVYVKYNEDGSFKSSVDKFFDENDLRQWSEKMEAQKGDLLLILSGSKKETLGQLNELRLHMGDQLGLRDPKKFKPVWITDFPLLEWDEENNRYHAMHHPFTSPIEEDLNKLESEPQNVRANAYDLAMNGVELGGGSIRIHDKKLQEQVFDTLGFTKEEAQKQFGFILDAFQYGAPPHGGIAFGLDRIVATMGGSDSIRDYIAFPKNNQGKDIMIKSPSQLTEQQLKELSLKINIQEE